MLLHNVVYLIVPYAVTIIKEKPLLPLWIKEVCGGAGGIRTHGTVAGTPDFEFSPILITAVLLRAFSVRFVTLKTLDFPGIFHGKP